MSKVEELREVLDAELVSDIDAVGDKVTKYYTLADAMRDGCKVTAQADNWGANGSACALSAAYLGARARGFAN